MRVSMRFVVLMLIVTLEMMSVSLGTTSPARAMGEEHLLVVFSESAIPYDADDAIRGLGGSIVRRLPEIGVLVVEANGPSTDDLAQALAALPSVYAVGRDFSLGVALTEAAGDEGLSGDVAVEGITPPNFGFPTIPVTAFDAFYLSQQQWSLTRIGADPNTWARSEGAGVKIAFLDTGVAPQHPDIAPNLDSAVSFVDVNRDNPKCDDGSAVDQLGHGTLVASLAAGARGPGTGFVVGVAPKARIRSYKVLRRVAVAQGFITPPQFDTPFNRCLIGRGEGEFSWILDGLNRAVDEGADIIVISAGGFIDKRNPEDHKAVYNALLRATNRAAASGVLIVAAAGNDGLNLNNLGPLVHLPSELPHVISVVATTNPAVPAPGLATGVDYLASYSNFGSSLHGLAAPGGETLGMSSNRLVRGACSPGIAGKPVGLPPNGTFGCFGIGRPGSAPNIMYNQVWYVRDAGTSYAAPHVAGVAALMKSANPTLDANQIRTMLQQTAEDIGKRGYDDLFNFGLVNATDAVNRALSK